LESLWKTCEKAKVVVKALWMAQGGYAALRTARDHGVVTR